MIKYLDFHAHKVQHRDDVKVVRSLFLQDHSPDDLSSDELISIGLHPWHADNMTMDEIESKLILFIESNRIVFIGESGLDKIKGASWENQMEVFRLHAQTADKYKIPLIVHSVRSHQEVLQVRKELKASVPWVIHSFTGSRQMAFDLINHGFYLSVCHHLLNEKSRISDYFCNLPIDRIFLETDDFNVSIYDLYKVAADKMKIPEEKFRKQLISNLEYLLNG